MKAELQPRQPIPCCSNSMLFLMQSMPTRHGADWKNAMIWPRRSCHDVEVYYIYLAPLRIAE